MVPVIYRSSLPAVHIASTSVFTHLFSSPEGDPNTIGGFPASAPAFIDAPSGATLTRGGLKDLALQFGWGIRHHPFMSLKRGDTIMIYSHNSLAWPVVLFGAVAAGLRITLANSGFNARELSHQYQDSGAQLVLTSEAGLPVVQEMFTKELSRTQKDADAKIIVLGNCLIWAGGPRAPKLPAAKGLLHLEDFLGKGKLTKEERFDEKLADTTTYICYSSGTTGKPKGVETTHRNVNVELDIIRPVFPQVEKVLGVLPFYHIFGVVGLLHFQFTIGGTLFIQQRFDPIQFCANVERYQISMAFVVPPILVVLARHPVVNKYDISSLEFLVAGAAPLGASLIKDVTQHLLKKGRGERPVLIPQGYGLTETSPITHVVPVPDAERMMGSIGVLLPNLEARLLMDRDGDGAIDAKPGEPGELWIRGPLIMKRYLNNPAATADAITPDGWFKTGDIATRDAEGFFHIVGRRKELIKYKVCLVACLLIEYKFRNTDLRLLSRVPKVKFLIIHSTAGFTGRTVPPAELESVLMTHPGVADAAVIGVESAKEATELPRAYVVPADASQVKTPSQRFAFEQHVQKWIEGQVARHKFLRGGVVVIDVVPKSATGKILRKELGERAKRELAGGDPAENIKSKL